MNSARLVPDQDRPGWRRKVVKFEGTDYPLVTDRFGWRLRSRSVHHPVNFCTGTFDLTLAKRKAREWLEQRKLRLAPRTTVTLEDVVAIYRTLPKRAGALTAKHNETMLRAVVRIATGRELRNVRLHEKDAHLWTRYMARMQGREVVDLSTRRPEHTSINSAVRAARSIFLEKLRAGYALHGVVLPPPDKIQWLQEAGRSPADYDEAAMLAAWDKLPANGQTALWRAVGLARFAGLRRKEVAACRGGWIAQQSGVWCVVVGDRPEEDFYPKTATQRHAPLIHAGLLAELRQVPAGALVVDLGEAARKEFFEHAPQGWLRQFMGPAVKKPLHRLRAAYLTEIRSVALIRLQSEATLLASQAGGHTTTATTRKSYLPPELG